MQGESFLAQLNSKKAKARQGMYYHYYENGEHAVSPHFGLSTGRYKLIRFYKRVESWELYDLKKDKREMKNLYHDKSYEKRIARLKRQLNRLIKQYDDSDAERILNLEKEKAAL
jgi:hypothetical protein